MNFFLVNLFFFSMCWAQENKGLTIAQKVEDYNKGFVGEHSIVEMKLINASGEEVIRELEIKVQESKDEGDKSLFVFLFPKDIKDTKLLTWVHESDDDDQWLYLPSFKKVKKITSHSKSGSFMGSEFTYEDLGGQTVSKFNYKFVDEVKQDKNSVWILERFPKNENSGYKRQKVWIDQKYMAIIKSEFYDKRDKLLKTAKSSDFSSVDKYWNPRKVHMFNHQTKKESILYWKKRELKKQFNSRIFHKGNLTD